MIKKGIALALCLVVLVSTSVIPSSASLSANENCPNGHSYGVKTVKDMIDCEPCDDYCYYHYISWEWTCCGAFEYDLDCQPHDFWMTGASYMTCSLCGYGRPVK